METNNMERWFEKSKNYTAEHMAEFTQPQSEDSDLHGRFEPAGEDIDRRQQIAAVLREHQWISNEHLGKCQYHWHRGSLAQFREYDGRLQEALAAVHAEDKMDFRQVNLAFNNILNEGREPFHLDAGAVLLVKEASFEGLKLVMKPEFDVLDADEVLVTSYRYDNLEYGQAIRYSICRPGEHCIHEGVAYLPCAALFNLLFATATGGRGRRATRSVWCDAVAINLANALQPEMARWDRFSFMRKMYRKMLVLPAYMFFVDSLYARRAWVFQEALLARRVSTEDAATQLARFGDQFGYGGGCAFDNEERRKQVERSLESLMLCSMPALSKWTVDQVDHLRVIEQAYVHLAAAEIYKRDELFEAVFGVLMHDAGFEHFIPNVKVHAEGTKITLRAEPDVIAAFREVIHDVRLSVDDGGKLTLDTARQLNNAAAKKKHLRKQVFVLGMVAYGHRALSKLRGIGVVFEEAHDLLCAADGTPCRDVFTNVWQEIHWVCSYIVLKYSSAPSYGPAPLGGFHRLCVYSDRFRNVDMDAFFDYYDKHARGFEQGEDGDLRRAHGQVTQAAARS